jgi:hypothetical protein
MREAARAAAARTSRLALEVRLAAVTAAGSVAPVPLPALLVLHTYY